MADYSTRILKEMQKLREGGATDVAYNVDTKKLTFADNGSTFEFKLPPTWPHEWPTVKVDGRTTYLTKYGPARTFRDIIAEYNRTKTDDSLPKILVLNNAPAGGGTRRRRARRRKTRRN